MWSRLNVVAMRRRWGSLAKDPGRLGRASVPADGSEERRSRRLADDALRRAFLAREAVIDCPYRGCQGLLLTRRREISRPGGTGARVVLRCTRHPETHDVMIALEPYSAEEVDQLGSMLLRGESLRCVRCGSLLQLGSLDSPEGWGRSVSSAPAYYCGWCGVRWVPASGERRAP
jgi:hypothetical protein